MKVRLYLISMALLLGCAYAPAAVIYSGALVWDAGESQIKAVGDWQAEGLSFSWTVEELDSGFWSYSYTFSIPGKDISHLIVETSPSLSEIDGLTSSAELATGGGQSYFFGTYSAVLQGSSNPQMPDEMYGVKFNLGESATVLTVSFTTDRQPIWGDFYAKAGGNTSLSVAYNAGFTAGDMDPSIAAYPPGSPQVSDHILVPDTLPEPATMAVLLAGSGLLCLRRLRRGEA